jgi:hypothetical protein
VVSNHRRTQQRWGTATTDWVHMSTTCIPNSVVTDKYIVYFAELLPSSRSRLTRANERSSQPASRFDLESSVETAPAAGSQDARRSRLKTVLFWGLFSKAGPLCFPIASPKNNPIQLSAPLPACTPFPMGNPRIGVAPKQSRPTPSIVYSHLNFLSQFKLRLC